MLKTMLNTRKSHKTSLTDEFALMRYNRFLGTATNNG